MAVSKLWSVKTRLGTVIDYATNPNKTTKAKSKYSEADYQALKDVLAYAKDEEKTEQEFFCQAINCNVATAREQFITVKERFSKTEGIQAYHGYLSFKDQDITPELAQKVGMEFAERVWGKRYQVVVTTHLNTKHLHCHFVINSVSFVDGRKLHDEEKAWFKFHHIADEICKKHELHTLDNPKRYQGKNFYVKKTLAGMPTRSNNAKAAIDYAVQHSHSMAEFSYTLSEMGYECNISPERKYWTIKPRGAEKALRMYRLGEDYTNQKILERVRANSYVLLEPFQKAVPKPRQYRFAGFTKPWELCKIKDLFKITRGYVLSASMTTDIQTEDMPYPVYSSQTKNNGLMGYYSQYLYENAITWTTDGANAGTVNFRDGKFYCTNVCGVLLADSVVPDQMISEALNSVAKNHVSYVGNPKLMNNVMAEITLTLPESEKERQVISALLSYYDNLISSHKQKLDELQSLKSGLLQQLFI